jgi:tRNA modification GTPase
MPRFTDTIAALATPAGTSAIAVLRVSGPEAATIARTLIGEAPPPRVARHGDYHDRGGTLLDDVLFTFFQGPHSYTGEDSLEISCHGNPFIAQKILEDLFGRGCRLAEPGEFTKRAFLNARMDLSQAEAVMDLISARSERALATANRQLRGSLGKQMTGLVDRLLNVIARVEAYIDFPEEDLPPEDRGFFQSELAGIARDTDRLLATSHYGEMLRDGIKTVIVGAPNVGKSSLLNRLVGRERALVSAEPGTTRDFIEERIIVGPHCLRIIDTAGLNPSPAPLEKLGMEKTMECLDDADLFLVVLDGSEPNPTIPAPLTGKLPTENSIIILNKSDLRQQLGTTSTPPSFAGAMPVSALTGAGISALVDAIVAHADRHRVDFSGDFIAINARHSNALDGARRALSDAQEKLQTGSAIELLASDLRLTLAAFGEIVGKVDNEAMLDRLFATFCIGK